MSATSYHAPGTLSELGCKDGVAENTNGYDLSSRGK